MGKFIIRKSDAGYSFNLKAVNGEIIATCSETFASKANCETGIESVRKNAPIAAIEDQTVEGFATEKNPKFEIYQDKAEEYRFRLKAANGEIIAKSQGYTTKANCKNGIDSVQKNAPDAAIEEVEE